MRFLRRLRLQPKITLLLLSIMAFIGLITAAFMLYFLRAAAIDNFRLMAESQAGIMLTSLEHEMLEGNPQHVQLELDNLVQRPLVNEVAVWSATGRIVFSGKREEVGLVPFDPGVGRVLRTGQAVQRTEDRYGSGFSLLIPVFAKPQCGPCHSAQVGEVMGVIEVGLEASSLNAYVRREGVIMGLTGLATFIAIGGALSLMLGREVIRPLSGLAQAAQRFSQGDHSARAKCEKEDELGTVARAFNQMADQVEKDTQELNAASARLALWGQELEAEVRKRTRELSALNAVVTAASRSLDQGQLLQEALEKMCEMMVAQGGSVHLTEGGDHKLALAARHIVPPGGLCCEACWGGGLASQAVQTGVVALAKDSSPEEGSPSALRPRVSIPLRSKQQVLGALTLCYDTPQPLDPEALPLLTAAGESLGVAVENAQLYQEVLAREQARGELLRRLITAQEEERKRVAQDLHDEIGQLLTALIMSADRAERALPPRMVREKETLAQARGMGEQALADLRRLILELRPEVLDDLGLAPAVRWYVRERLQKAGIKAQVEAQGLEDRLPHEVEVLLFRAIQEAITNILRHAQASQVYIFLKATPAAVTAQIEDDGQGFEVEKVLGKLAVRGGGWGLRGIRERLALVGGSLRIESQSGKGTRLFMEIPVKEVLS